MSKPVAVLISDVHYNLNTLPLANAAMLQAIEKANVLEIPLIVAGDLHDTKASLRGECIKVMRNTFRQCEQCPYILAGNHDLINERGLDNSLIFLEDLAHIVDIPIDIEFSSKTIELIPYYSDPEKLKSYLATVPKGSTLIMHQGVSNSNSGHYIQDKSALPKECFEDFRVISGHYHTRQDIVCGRPRKGAVGLFSYIGNPYTLNFGEANDPPKGFQILMDDGTLEFVPTNLRQHHILELDCAKSLPTLRHAYHPGNLLWVKIKGSREQLGTINKETLSSALGLTMDFRLDLIPTDTTTQTPENAKNLTKAELLDSLIDNSTSTEDSKDRLKKLWRDL